MLVLRFVVFTRKQYTVREYYLIIFLCGLLAVQHL